MKKKICKQCGIERLLSLFKRASWHRDMHSNTCRFCENERSKRYAKKKKEGVIEAF